MRFPFSEHDRYQLVRELGEGAYGVSFLVRDLEHEGREVVLVLIERDYPADIEIFRREIESLARLTHPNLVPFLEPFIESGHVGYTRDFVPGKDLRAFWDQERGAAPSSPALDLNMDFSALEDAPGAGDESEGEDDELDEGVVPKVSGAGEDRGVIHTPLDLNSIEVERELETLSDETDEIGEIISQVSRPLRTPARKKTLDERLGALKAHLPEVLSGLEHLHRFKRAHGTLHPGCIFLHEETGRWQIADFGLPSLISSASEEETSPTLSSDMARSRWRQRRAWTYRAPELFTGQAPTPAADIYALGCILYEAFAERPPFDGLAEEIGTRHREEIPVSLLELQPRCPSSWAQLVDEMLHKQPARRPELEAIVDAIAHLEDAPSSLPPSFIPAPAVLAGREEILEEILTRAGEAERASELATIVLAGEEGVGKHHLFEHVCSTLSRRGWLILRGRCYEDRAEPYQGWRPMILQLLELLNHCPPALAVELGEARRLAAAIFPELSPNPDRSEQTETLQRLEATSALRRLIGALSKRRPVMLGFDELHLARRDTLELLHDFRSGNMPFKGIVLATSKQSAKQLFPSRDRENVPSILTREMDSEEARHFIETIARDDESDRFTAFLEERETHHPLLLKELLYEVQRRWHSKRPDDVRTLLTKPLGPRHDSLKALTIMLGERLERLSGEALMLLRVLALTAGPTALDVLAGVQEQLHIIGGDEPSEASASETALTKLCAMRLAKRLPSGRRTLPSYRIANEIIRQHVLAQLSASEHTDLCRALAETIIGESASAHAKRFEYYRLGGLTEEARAHVVPALEDARRHLAFGRASELKRWQLEHAEDASPEELRELRAQLSEFESATGRYAVAAELLHTIARDLDAGTERTRALSDEAQAWFHAGELERAEAALQEALRYFGERYTTSIKGGWFNLMRERWGRLRLGSLPSPDTLGDARISGEEGIKLRLYTLMLQTHHVLNGAKAPTIQRRLEEIGRRHNDRRTLASAFLFRAQILLSLDRPRALREAGDLLDLATRLFEALEDQEHMTRVLVARAQLEQLRGAPERARAHYEEADRRWRTSTNHTRLARASLDLHRGMQAIELGRLDLASRWLEALFHEERHLEPARLGGHQLAAEVALLRGRPDMAQLHIEEVRARLANLTPSRLSLWSIDAQTRHHIAVGRPEVAIGQLEVHIERIRESGFIRFPTVEAILLRALGWALSSQLEREWAMDSARRKELSTKLQATTRRLRRLQVPGQTIERCALERLRARQEWLLGKPRRALRILDEAVQDPEHIPGALEQAKFAEARSLLLAELEREGAQDLNQQANQMYDLLQICSPLILEGWPIPEGRSALSRDEG